MMEKRRRGKRRRGILPPVATLTILLMTLHTRKIPQRELTTTMMTAVTMMMVAREIGLIRKIEVHSGASLLFCILVFAFGACAPK
ncbi:hypothetical protein RHMOL_Rhmol05G0147400 [Rhododendron molle]|uniref:Uncharacterized protein n=1 Tax=Rhododendron molle TaxID=49168 RepID=A0ACC0NQ28_RHOML|nr:hypothetical protein RHMOL_Rhmol05G0147400 [Rhododendron molle]